jgi:hypothetical protein
MTLRSLPTSEWTPNSSCSLLLRQSSQARRWCRRTLDDLLDVGERPMAARLPGRSTNCAAASTFGPIEPAAKSLTAARSGVT